MLIKLKNKQYLVIDEFKFKCSVGKNGLKTKKKEGDNSTPKGNFKIGKVYYRSDRVRKPETRLKTKIIRKNTKSSKKEQSCAAVCKSPRPYQVLNIPVVKVLTPKNSTVP